MPLCQGFCYADFNEVSIFCGKWIVENGLHFPVIIDSGIMLCILALSLPVRTQRGRTTFNLS